MPLLSRIDFRTRFDRETQAYVVEYAGKAVRFDDRIYGYPEGTFFVLPLRELPLPERLEELAREAHVDLRTHPNVPDLIRAIGEALQAEAILEAPVLLGDVASPRCKWSDSDGRELERRHAAAVNRVEEWVHTICADIEMSMQDRKPWDAPMPRFSVMDPPPSGFEGRSAPVEPEPAPAQEDESDVADETPAVERDHEMERAAKSTIERVIAAVKAAREAELPQRLPTGMRRKLGAQPPASYVVADGSPTSATDVEAAMVTAKEKAKGGVEAVVVDWDGEWPVVVRRYGENGRTVYRVEDALRRVTGETPA